MSADVLVNCITLPDLKYSLTPALSPANSMSVVTWPILPILFYVFEASSRFGWMTGLRALNMEFEHPDISSIWEEPTWAESLVK